MKYVHAGSEKIPALGFGTYRLAGQSCVNAVKDAISLGYRHIDTAEMYGNEKETGEGVRQSGIPRNDVFVTTKLWTDSLAPDEVHLTAEQSLTSMQMDYLDLLLIHWPSSRIPLDETLGAMNQLREEGKVRHLGVSNFNIGWLDKAHETGVPLITNQVEYHAMLGQEKLLGYLRSKGMFLTAYSPLAKGRLVNHPTLLEIGKKYGKTDVQIALRWLVQQDDVALVPKASSPEKRRNNFDIFDFELDAEDLERIDGIEKNRRIVDLPGLSPEWD